RPPPDPRSRDNSLQHKPFRGLVPRWSFALNRFLPFVLLIACGSTTTPNSNPKCQPGTSTALNASCDPGFTATAPNKPGSIEVTFSGEVLGVAGLPFNPAHPGDPVFVDGWSVTFDELLVV